MRRRDFVVGLLLTATTASARAQQKAKVYRLAVVDTVNPVIDTHGGRRAALLSRLLRAASTTGICRGTKSQIKRYSGEGQSERFDDMVSEVVNLKPDESSRLAPGCSSC